MTGCQHPKAIQPPFPLLQRRHGSPADLETVRAAAPQSRKQTRQRPNGFLAALDGQIVDRHHAIAVSGDAHGVGCRRSIREDMVFVQIQQFSPQQLFLWKNLPGAGDPLREDIGNGAALGTRCQEGFFRLLQLAVFPWFGAGRYDRQQKCDCPRAQQQAGPIPAVLPPTRLGLPALSAPAVRPLSGYTDVLSAPFPLRHQSFGHIHPSR